MNIQSPNTNAVSPVLAIILLIGVTVILSAAVGFLVLGASQSTTEHDPNTVGVAISEDEPGIITIHTKTGEADPILILVNGEELRNETVEPDDSIELRGVPESARISIIDASGSSEQVVVSQEVSEGDPFATAPTDVASIHDNMSTTGSGAFIITNVYELQAMNQNLSAEYVLGNDIHASGTRYWNDGKGFDPIGDTSTNFTGLLNGAGYEVDGLYSNRPSTNYVGLIGYSGTESSISDIGVVNADVTGNDQVGGLVGLNYGDVTSSYSTGSVSSDEFNIGGLVGLNYGDVTSSYSTGSVRGNNNVGGLVGDNAGTVSESYATGDIRGAGNLGGLVGWNYDAVVERSYATGDVRNDLFANESGYYYEFNIGGLIGRNDIGTVSDSYATGDVTGTDEVGGLVGLNYDDGTVTSSYATGDVSGEDAGGLVGWNYDADVKKSYSTGSVNGTGGVGGLIGWNYDGGYAMSSHWSDTSDTDDATGEVDNNDDSGVDTILVSEGTGSDAVTELGFDSGVWNNGGITEYPELAWESG